VYRIFGLIPGEMIITYQTALEMVHPDDRAVVQNAMDQAISSSLPFNLDHKIVLPDGQERIINLTAVPFFERPGVSTKMVGTVQDITERVRIKSELLEKERMSNELTIGHRIQLSMLPNYSPSVDGWQFAGFYQAASEVGGDFYDWINLPNGEIGMMIADASDKGVPAALFMALSRAIIRTNALGSDGPVATMVRSNEILFRDYFNEQFVTMIYASLDPANGHIEIVNAGHNYPLLYSSKNRGVQTIKTKGTVLGLFPQVPLDPVSIELMPGDVLVFYTDGLTEAINSQEDYFDEQRVIEAVKANAYRSVDEIISAIVQSWQDFVGELPQMDDLTLIVAKRDNPKEDV
jgi:sigma-B regulation protein RsbU (phosphoserine phosphatase)